MPQNTGFEATAQALANMNVTFHCAECGNPLGRNRYTISPFSGKRCRNHAWCPRCYEMLYAWFLANIARPARMV